MDEADITEKNREYLERSNLHKSKRFTPETTYTGQCWYCGEKVEAPRRWCNVNCRDDWQTVNDL